MLNTLELNESAKKLLANVFSPKYEGNVAVIPENIKKGISLLGVEGSYEGDKNYFTVTLPVNGEYIDISSIYDVLIRDNVLAEIELEDHSFRKIFLTYGVQQGSGSGESISYWYYSPVSNDADDAYFMIGADQGELRLFTYNESVENLKLRIDLDNQSLPSKYGTFTLYNDYASAESASAIMSKIYIDNSIDYLNDLILDVVKDDTSYAGVPVLKGCMKITTLQDPSTPAYFEGFISFRNYVNNMEMIAYCPAAGELKILYRNGDFSNLDHDENGYYFDIEGWMLDIEGVTDFYGCAPIKDDTAYTSNTQTLINGAVLGNLKNE